MFLPDKQFTRPFLERCQPQVVEIIGGIFFQDRMEIGSSETEGAYPSPARVFYRVANPGTCLGVYVKGSIREAKSGIGFFHTDRGRQDLMMQSQGRLH